jgi:hypothetical protein
MSKKKKSYKKPSVDSIFEETPVVEEVYVEAPKAKPVIKKVVLLQAGVNSGSKFEDGVLRVAGKKALFASRKLAIIAKKRYGGKVVEKDNAFQVHK